MGWLDKIRDPLQRVWDWAYKFFKKATLSVEHVEAIQSELARPNAGWRPGP